MNNLSWMIYLAGVVDNINTTLALVTVSSLLAFALGTAVWLSTFDDTDTHRQGLRVMRYSFVTGVAALTLSAPEGRGEMTHFKPIADGRARRFFWRVRYRQGPNWSAMSDKQIAAALRRVSRRRTL